MNKNTVAYFIRLRVDQSCSVLLFKNHLKSTIYNGLTKIYLFPEAQMTSMQYSLSTIVGCCFSIYVFIMHKPLFEMFHSRAWNFQQHLRNPTHSQTTFISEQIEIIQNLYSFPLISSFKGRSEASTFILPNFTGILHLQNLLIMDHSLLSDCVFNQLIHNH